jgi:two-component sensor histidine kinase
MEKLLLLLPERPPPILVRYGATTLMIALLAVLQAGVQAISGFVGFFLLLPGIFLAGLVFDRGSSIYATLLSAAIGLWFIHPTLDTLNNALIAVFLFVLTGVALGAIGEALRVALEKVVKQEKAKDLLLAEIGHRIKNNLMAMTSLLRLQARGAESAEAKIALHAAADRIQVMADVHDFLRDSSPGSSVDMSRYLAELCHKLGDTLRGVRPIAMQVHADRIELPTEKAVPIAIITNELVTNSFKYAFPDNRSGTVTVTLHRNDHIELTVADNGVGCGPDAPEKLGSRLMQLMTQQLGGTLTRTLAKPGCTVVLRIP